MVLGQRDDNAIPIPAVFIFVPALNVILDKAHPGHRVSADTILHFGPPAGIMLASETTRGLHFVGMPAGTVLLTPISTKIKSQKKRPWKRGDVVRRGLPCVAAFACTDYKMQSRMLDRAALELRGTRTTTVNGVAATHSRPCVLPPPHLLGRGRNTVEAADPLQCV
ncbi:hypothetical protein RB593_010039 [Gaeumannomyces tritici]